ncbi:MAG: glycosyltransferase family 4 protein [Candidatus Thorarchaeota archaeon]|nr:glycosyltransferase family 4 protein [Candidatus Thorarchaeota archaeon]
MNPRETSRLSRVLVFAEHFPPFLGSDRTVFELSSRLADRGIRVHYVTTQPLRYLLGARPPDWSYKENWTKGPPKIHRLISAEYLLVGPRVERLWRRFVPLAYLLTVVLFIMRSLWTAAHFKPDVMIGVHATPIVGLVAAATSRMTMCPLLMGCPDWMTAYAAGLKSSSISSIGPVFLQKIETALYRVSDRVFASTHFLKRLLVSHGVRGSRITVIPNGVDTTIFHPEVDTSAVREKYRLHDTCVVLFAGHLEIWAGLSLIIDLAQRLDHEGMRATILLVGTGDYVSDLFAKLVKQNLGHMVIHAGLQPYSSMPAFVAASDIALCIFPDTPLSHAASPLKLFEYMGGGKAIVATRVAGTQEVVDDTHAVLVPPRSISAVCDAVVRLCGDPRLRTELGSRARALAIERHDWNHLSHLFMRECERVLRH